MLFVHKTKIRVRVQALREKKEGIKFAGNCTVRG